MGPSRPNPSGGSGLRAISLSLVVADVPASPPPLFATSPASPIRKRYRIYESEYLKSSSGNRTTASGGDSALSPPTTFSDSF